MNHTTFYANLSKQRYSYVIHAQCRDGVAVHEDTAPTHSDIYLKHCSTVTLITGSQSLFVILLGLQVSNSSVTSHVPLPFPTSFRTFRFLFFPPGYQLSMFSPTRKTQAYPCNLLFFHSFQNCLC
jgi:hypothetical protein